jgi:hypothetical protein
VVVVVVVAGMVSGGSVIDCDCCACFLRGVAKGGIANECQEPSPISIKDGRCPSSLLSSTAPPGKMPALTSTLATKLNRRSFALDMLGGVRVQSTCSSVL